MAPPGIKKTDSLDILTGFASGLFRVLAYLFLRWFPGRQGPFATPSVYFLFLMGWLANDSKLLALETQANNAMNRNAAKFQTGSTDVAVREGGVKKEDVAEATKISGVVENGKVDKVVVSNGNGKSYADVVKKEVKDGGDKVVGVVDKKSPLDPEPSNPRTTTTPALSTSPLLPIPPRPTPFTLLTGSPSSSRFYNKISLLINTLLLIFVLDCAWSPTLFRSHTDLAFSRVGSVSDTSAKILVRIPPPHGTEDDPSPGTVLDRVSAGASAAGSAVVDAVFGESAVERVQAARIMYRQTPNGKWLIGPAVEVNNVSDWVGLALLRDLVPSTEYEYSVGLPLSPLTPHPSFTSTPLPRFKTSPDPRLSSQTHYTFVSGSCMMPGWPYVPGQARERLRGAELLAGAIKNNSIEFMMFMGDFIYADVPQYGGPKSEMYMKRYRQVYSSKDYQGVYRQIPTYHIYDDHEIYNDYAGLGRTNDTVYSSAVVAYDAYQGSGNPDPVKPGVKYYSFRYGDSAFFVWDTRRYRSSNNSPDVPGEKTMLGEEQKQEFYHWLNRVNGTVTWKFVVSSVPFQTLWGSPLGGTANDTWAGFQAERDELMDVMEYVPNIIVLSGDRHEFAATSIRNTVLDISTSPLNMFYLPIRTLSQNNGRGKTGEETLLKYLPDGNFKFSTFEVDTRTANKPKVTLKAFIDGKVAWKLEILGKPIRKANLAVGSLSADLLELLGFRKRKWF